MAKRGANGVGGGGNMTNGAGPRGGADGPRQPPRTRAGATLQVTPRGTAKRVAAGPVQRQAPTLPEVDNVFDDAMGMGLGPTEEDRLAVWIEDLVTAGPVARLELQQVVGGGGTAPVRDWSQQELADMGEAQGIAGEIMASAQEDCESSGKFSRYVVCATRPGAAAYFRRFFFSVQPPPVDGAGFASEYGAEGLVSQAHRHVEQTMRLALGSAAASMRTIIMQNVELSTLARSAWAAQGEAAAAREKLLDRELERSFFLRKQTKIQDRYDRAFHFAEALVATVGVPALMQHMGAPPDAIARAVAVGSQLVGAPMPATSTTNAPSQPRVNLHGERALITAAMAALAKLVGEVPEPMLDLLLARLAPADQQTVRTVRQRMTAEDGEPTAADHATMTKFADVACRLVASVTDAELGVIVGQLDNAGRVAVQQLREVLRSKAAPPAPPPAEAAPGAV